MHLYFNKEGKLTTAIPHGEIPRQGNYLNLYILLDSDFFISKGENHLNWTVSLELSFPNGELTIPFLPSKEPEFKTFVKNSGSEVTYDLVDEETYLTYEFNFTPEQATMNPGKFEALVSITKTNADLNKQGVAEGIDVESISYFGKAEIYIEKTFGSNKVIDNEASSHYKNLINLLKNLDSRKINKEFFYEELKRLSVDEVEVMELIEQYSANTESLEIGDSEKYRFERDDQIPTSKAVADNFVRKAGDTINGVLYTDANTPYVIGKNNKVGIRAVDEKNGVNVGQFAVSNTNEELYEGHWANIQVLGSDGKYYSIRLSKAFGPQYREGSETYRLTTDADLAKYTTLDTAQDVNGVKNFTNGFKIKNNRVYADSSERTVLTYKDESKIKIGGYETLSANTLSPDRDNNFDLGRSGLKWKDLYLSGYIISGESIIKASKIADKDYVDSLFATLSSVKFEIVDELPTKDISNTTIYLKKREKNEEHNVYEEYIYIKNNWEMIGTTALDLENLKQYIDERIENYHPTYEYELDVLKGSEWIRVAEVMDEAKNSSGLFTFDCYGLNGDGTYSLMTTSTFSCTCGLDGSGKMVVDVLPISHSPELTAMDDASGGSGGGSGDGSGESGTYGLVSVNFERYDNQLYLCALVNYPSTDKYNKLIVNLKLENNLNFKPLNELEVVDFSEVNSNEMQVLEGMTLKANAPYEWRIGLNLQHFIDGIESLYKFRILVDHRTLLAYYTDSTSGKVGIDINNGDGLQAVKGAFSEYNPPYDLFNYSRTKLYGNRLTFSLLSEIGFFSYDGNSILPDISRYLGTTFNHPYFNSVVTKISGKITLKSNLLTNGVKIILNDVLVCDTEEYTFENLDVEKDVLIFIGLSSNEQFNDMAIEIDFSKTKIEFRVPYIPESAVVLEHYEIEHNDIYQAQLKLSELLPHETTKSYEMYSVYNKLEIFEEELSGEKLEIIELNSLGVNKEQSIIWEIAKDLLSDSPKIKTYSPCIISSPDGSYYYARITASVSDDKDGDYVMFTTGTILRSLSDSRYSIRFLKDTKVHNEDEIRYNGFETYSSVEQEIIDVGDYFGGNASIFFIRRLIFKYLWGESFKDVWDDNDELGKHFIVKATGWYEGMYREEIFYCFLYISTYSGTKTWELRLTKMAGGITTYVCKGTEDLPYETEITFETINYQTQLSQGEGIKIEDDTVSIDPDEFKVNSLDFGDGATITKDSSNRVNINYSGNTKVKVGSAETLFTGRVTPDSGKQYDLGRSGLEWKDLYLSGNITDGTNNVSVSQIQPKLTAGAGITIDENNVISISYENGDEGSY